MNIDTQIEGAKAVLKVEGKLTVQTSPDLEAAIGKLDRGISDIDIDLSDVSYVSSAGLRVLVGASKLTTTRGGTMRLLHPVDDVMDVFEMTGLVTVFTVVR